MVDFPRGERFETEKEIEARFVDAIKSTSGILLVACSAQNIDRVVSVYRAAKRCGRQLLVDAYAAEVLKATDTRSIPKPTDEWSDVKVYIPQAQRRLLLDKNIAHVVDGYKGRRIFPEALPSVAPKSVMIVRPWMLKDLERHGALEGAKVIWSQWEGYLEQDSGQSFRSHCAASGIPFEVIHTSGHADPHDLQRFAAAVNPDVLVPIHTFHPDRFGQLFSNVRTFEDGQWFSI